VKLAKVLGTVVATEIGDFFHGEIKVKGCCLRLQQFEGLRSYRGLGVDNLDGIATGWQSGNIFGVRPVAPENLIGRRTAFHGYVNCAISCTKRAGLHGFTGNGDERDIDRILIAGHSHEHDYRSRKDKKGCFSHVGFI